MSGPTEIFLKSDQICAIFARLCYDQSVPHFSDNLSPGALLHRSYKSRPAIKHGRSWALFICVTVSGTDCNTYIAVRAPRPGTVQFVNHSLDVILTETLSA